MKNFLRYTLLLSGLLIGSISEAKVTFNNNDLEDFRKSCKEKSGNTCDFGKLEAMAKKDPKKAEKMWSELAPKCAFCSRVSLVASNILYEKAALEQEIKEDISLPVFRGWFRNFSPSLSRSSGFYKAMHFLKDRKRIEEDTYELETLAARS